MLSQLMRDFAIMRFYCCEGEADEEILKTNPQNELILAFTIHSTINAQAI